MLVLTTMFINVSNNLPKTSYIKMMDIWLIFNLLVPFVEILLHTYMDMLRLKPNKVSILFKLVISGVKKVEKLTTMVGLFKQMKTLMKLLPNLRYSICD